MRTSANCKFAKCTSAKYPDVIAPNPFHYGTPANAEHFAGRREELSALTTRMADGINVVLSSPRRYGKTSLLLLAEAEMDQQDTAVIHVNVLRCRDIADLAAQMAAGAYRLPGRWHRTGQALAEFVRRLRISPTVSFAADGSPRFGFASDLAIPDAEAIIADVYGLLAEERPKHPAVLVMDEFQAITDLGEHLPGLMKALADQYGRVALVLAGSRAHLMERLAGSTGAPLYGMAERLSLGPISADAMSEYLQRRSVVGGKPMSAEVASWVLGRAGPVPNDIQRLAYAAFEVSANQISASDVDVGMALTVAHDAANYADTFQRLTTAQRRVLAALAVGATEPLYSSRFARSVGLASGASVSRVIEALADHELIARRNGKWSVADPFLVAWVTGLSD